VHASFIKIFVQFVQETHTSVLTIAVTCKFLVGGFVEYFLGSSF